VNGRVADVIRCSWVDGPGARFVVFLQGCNFDCLACHNPQTIPASSTSARTMTVDDVLALLRPVAAFVSGVTVSGGEPTVQAGFVRELFAAIKASEERDVARLTTFVDSNGHAPLATWHALAPVMDAAMVDLKALDPAAHRALTGRSNERVLASIRELASMGKLHEVRLLLVPGVNDDEQTLRATRAWLADAAPGVPVVTNRYSDHGVRPPAAALLAGAGAGAGAS
jgi:pyruvate-formate lyase-activating enzyme